VYTDGGMRDAAAGVCSIDYKKMTAVWVCA